MLPEASSNVTSKGDLARQRRYPFRKCYDDRLQLLIADQRDRRLRIGPLKVSLPGSRPGGASG